jgi:hypothetical protein
MLFIVNKLFTFLSFILKRKIIKFFKLKNYFSYFLFLFLILRPGTALCEGDEVEDLMEEKKFFNKKIIFYSLLCLTLIGFSIALYYYSGSTDSGGDSDVDSELEYCTKMKELDDARAAEYAVFKADSDAFWSAYKIDKKIAVENWEVAKIHYLQLKSEKNLHSPEELYRAMVELAAAEKKLNSIHIANSHYLYRPFTERRFVD